MATAYAVAPKEAFQLSVGLSVVTVGPGCAAPPGDRPVGVGGGAAAVHPDTCFGEPLSSTLVPENFTNTLCAVPSFRIVGVASVKPCSPLSPKYAPTSGRLWFAVSVDSSVVPSNMSTLTGWFSRLRSAAQPWIILHPVVASTHPTDCVQLSDFGEPLSSTLVPENFTNTLCAVPSFRIVGVASVKPCSPLS